MATSLAEAKQKEKSMIEYSVDAICSLDGSGRITAANPACANILGHTQDAILGNNLKNILVREDLQDFNESLLRAKSGKSQSQVESRVTQSNGNTIDVLWSLHWVQSEESFFCVGHDITERKEVERLKQQFMAMVSHDLRTPLSTIANYLEMLGAGLFGQLTEKGEHLLQIAESNVNRMLALINDLLDLERAEFAGLKIECSPQQLGSLVDQSINSVKNLALKKQIHMEFDKTDLVVQADDNRIVQVLVNLLSNAIKFSPKDGIVNVSVEGSDDKAWVRISDQGRGVPPHMKEKIFEHFQQVEISDSVEKGGSGLGLAICKAIVELHGGTIKVEENAPSGSTFSFSLPLAKVAEKQVA
jgi:PAS domain S-box-containing protein